MWLGIWLLLCSIVLSRDCTSLEEVHMHYQQLPSCRGSPHRLVCMRNSV